MLPSYPGEWWRGVGGGVLPHISGFPPYINICQLQDGVNRGKRLYLESWVGCGTDTFALGGGVIPKSIE